MSYVTAAKRPNPVAAMGALGVPAAFGALMIIGLAVTGTAPEKAKDIVGIFVPIDEPEVPPEPVPQPPSETASETVVQQQTYTPPTRPDTPFTFVTSDSTPIGGLVDPGPTVLKIDPVDFGPTTPPPPMFDPVAASPRGNPGNWVTNSDYRTPWINRGYEGVASFTLMVDVSGRVSGCTITSSTGHPALDDATCRLLERRGRFDPAKDASGKTVAGTYRSSIRWTIPE